MKIEAHLLTKCGCRRKMELNSHEVTRRLRVPILVTIDRPQDYWAIGSSSVSYSSREFELKEFLRISSDLVVATFTEV